MKYTASARDAALIERCLEGDRLAQKQLYMHYKDAMYTLAYRITGDYDLANDVLQDAFVNIFRRLDQYQGKSTLGAWIKTIVVRAAIKTSKKKLQFEPLDHHSINSQIDWGHYLETEYLEKAILSLPEGYRTVFMLVEVEGYGHKEVAKMLDISEGTSKSQLFYAKKKLRNILDTFR